MYGRSVVKGMEQAFNRGLKLKELQTGLYLYSYRTYLQLAVFARRLTSRKQAGVGGFEI
jgi:hypothetical protein